MHVKKFFATVIMAAAVFVLTVKVDAASAQTHTVQKGDTLYKIGLHHGVSVAQLKAVNNKNGSLIMPGEQLTIPSAPTNAEKNLVARLVEAEAKGESYAGKVAVATVVFNRVESDDFPDSIHGVIYDGRQFSPVLNGTINQPASQASKDAVEEAIAYQGMDNGSLFFYNPDKVSNAYLSGKEVTVVIGNHRFAR
ncbi:cell wall hydrolase [Thalassobacillus sp. CUG 92003]|uniref:cell wall hydrolase n=1 Tax=Thalassobacillus sp. CUG 92003 TaxID=2736641 RepID=UPI00210364D7|nr:cell wall hydrolase [Thalassobacillus sp. CUG 92003]